MSATTCPSGPGAFPDTICMHLTIDGLGVPAIDVELRVTERDGGTPERGTVLLGSGLGGGAFYGEEAGGDAFVPSLTAAGFRVVDRAWSSGWFLSGPSITPQSGRYATLVTWVHDNLHGTGTFCVTGNSGGAAEIAYALAAWRRAEVIDVAVLSSGPPMTRLDYFCESPPSTEWIDICTTIVPDGVMECGNPACTAPLGNFLCPILPTAPQPGELEADSILSPDAELDYPGTVLHGLFGAQDCSIAVPQGLLYLTAVTSPTVIEFVPGAPHLIPEVAGGRAALLQALLDATSSLPAGPVQARGGLRWTRDGVTHVETSR